MAEKRKSPSSTRAITNQTKDSVPETPLSGQDEETRIEPGATLEVEEASWFQSPNALFDYHIQVISIERQKGKGKAVPVTREIRPVEMLVYIYLRRCGNNGAKAFPSYTTIATRCRITRPTAIKAVETLERSGLLTKRPTMTSKGDQGVNNYYLRSPKGTPFKDYDGVVKSAYQGGGKMSIPPVVKPAYQGGMLILPYKEPSIKNHLDQQQQAVVAAVDSIPEPSPEEQKQPATTVANSLLKPSPEEIQELINCAAEQEIQFFIEDGYASNMIRRAGSLDKAKEKIEAATAYIKKERRAGHKINSIGAIMNRMMTVETGGIKLGRGSRGGKYEDLYCN